MSTIDTYMEDQEKFWLEEPGRELGLMNATLGLVGEAGEFAELVKKSIFHEVHVNLSDVVSELGDVFFYWIALCKTYGLDPHEVIEANITKLEKRYPDGFVVGGGNRG
jgi:NTP pyrophosphatase (non-canonical NTP hydrolase)